MVNSRRRAWSFLILLVCGFLAACAVHFYPKITVNNRFVCYAIVVDVVIFGAICLFVTRQKLLRNMLLVVVGMAGFAFVLVPIYNVFCDVTGLNGKIDLSKISATPHGIDLTRTITVEFVVSHNREMPWEFRPKHQTLKVHPGELVATAYYAKNPTSRTMIAQAIPSITPSKVSRYFKKVECFCFSNQKLGPGETAHLGLRFYLDPSFPADVHRLTLAYTIFDVTDTADIKKGKRKHS